MKYSDANPPLVCMQTQSTCYKKTSKMKVKGVLWHSTGANNPNLKRYVQPSDDAKDRDAMLKLLGTNANHNDWNHVTRSAGLNAWIGKLADGSVTTVQSMPWDYRPWGCGEHPTTKYSCNSGWIQFEICEDGLNDREYAMKVYQEACELTAYLCQKYGLDPNGTVQFCGVTVPVLTCHGDAYKLKVGSPHNDINHWFPKFGKNMATVRDDVAALLKESEDDDMTYYQTVKEVPKWYKPTIEKLMAKKVLQGIDDKGTLNISEDYCRVMTTLDRLGKLD